MELACQPACGACSQRELFFPVGSKHANQTRPSLAMTPHVVSRDEAINLIHGPAGRVCGPITTYRIFSLLL